MIADYRKPDRCAKMQDKNANDSNQEHAFVNLHAALADSDNNEDMNSETSDEIRCKHMRE